MNASSPASRPSKGSPRGWPLLAALVLAGACAPRNVLPAERAGAAEACEPERDRAAILKMAGNYRVDFAFDETVSLTEGYALHEPYRAKATEVVLVLEDTPRKVSLQHILVLERDGKRSSLKHWRQDWTFEDAELLEFRGHRSWERHTLSPTEARCSWSQAVFEVDDGPRYEGSGRWRHDNGVSAWESGETWRPLPRREYTKRSDYDVLVGTNRHALTPTGWVHEQDSLKRVLGATPHALARERGLNVYTRQPAEVVLPEPVEYWKQNQEFWGEVRQQWQAFFQEHARFTLKDRVEEKFRHEHLFELAEFHEKNLSEGHPDMAPTRERIHATLEGFREPAPGEGTAQAQDRR